jgi:hypothetical protein
MSQEGRGAEKVSPDQASFPKSQTDLQGENQILDLISMGAPLREILKKLCKAIDLQIGNVVSVIVLEDDAEHHLETIVRGARQCGLHVFSSASIALPDEDLGSLEMYCCISRTPTALEFKLIERVTHLAALAIRRHNGEENVETSYGDRKSAGRRHSRELHRVN